MKRLNTLVFFLIVLLPLVGFAQERNCATMEVLDRLQAEDPAMARRMEAIEQHTQNFLQEGTQSRDVVTIPVVVHVVYQTVGENISVEQIQSQIDVLNKDFRALNADISGVPSVFQSVIGNAEVQFCLATRDPNGLPTTGITRKSTSRRFWGTSDLVKRSASGGVDAWDASRYLNIWVATIGNNILGYAQFPGGNPATDGIVVDSRYFGTIGSVRSPYNRGRTTTHEVGHWLNLRHIWGDAACGNDFVDDTPVHNASNSGCPTFPHLSTCTGTPVEMTMNYMDYTQDGCMYMFSAGQAARMRAVLAPGGARASLLNSNGCQATSGGGGGGGSICAAPTGLQATNIEANSATLRWNTVAGATSYNVRIRPVGTSTWATASTSGTSLNATGLSASTNYEFQVQTVCGSATSTTYTAANFTTASGVTPNCDDRWESNNTRTNARTISVGIPIQALLNTPQDEDWFKFTIQQRNIRVTLSTLPQDYDLQLYRNTSVVGSSRNEGTADEQIVLNNASLSGTYSVRVSGYNGAFDPIECYTLYVETQDGSFRQAGGITLEEVTALPTAFGMFPNPATNTVTLDIPIESEAATQITLFDLAGKVVQRHTEALSKGNTTTTIPLQNLPGGVYLVRVQNGHFIANQKLVIQK